MTKRLKEHLKKIFKEFKLEDEVFDDAIRDITGNTYMDALFDAKKYIEYYLIKKCSDDIDVQIELLEKYNYATFPIKNIYGLDWKLVEQIYEDSFEFIIENYDTTELLSKNILKVMLSKVKEKTRLNYVEVEQEKYTDEPNLIEGETIKDESKTVSIIEEVKKDDEECSPQKLENDNIKDNVVAKEHKMLQKGLENKKDDNIEEFYDISFLNKYLVNEKVDQLELVEYMGVSHDEFYEYKIGKKKINEKILTKLLEFLSVDSYTDLIEKVSKEYFCDKNKTLYMNVPKKDNLSQISILKYIDKELFFNLLKENISNEFEYLILQLLFDYYDRIYTIDAVANFFNVSPKYVSEICIRGLEIYKSKLQDWYNSEMKMKFVNNEHKNN